MYPLLLLNNPPAPTYPQYEQVVNLARELTPRFVDPSNLHPERGVEDRRGADWCTAVLGRPFNELTRRTVHEQYLLIAADRLDVDPPLPDWIVKGRQAAADAEAERRRRVEEAQQRDLDTWAAALAGVTVELDVHYGSRARVRGSLYVTLGHAVPRADVYSGARKPRTHQRGRALCETPTRTKPLDISNTPAPAGTPATCVRCLEWAPKVRATP